LSVSNDSELGKPSDRGLMIDPCVCAMGLIFCKLEMELRTELSGGPGIERFLIFLFLEKSSSIRSESWESVSPFDDRGVCTAALGS